MSESEWYEEYAEACQCQDEATCRRLAELKRKGKVKDLPWTTR